MYLEDFKEAVKGRYSAKYIGMYIPDDADAYEASQLTEAAYFGWCAAIKAVENKLHSRGWSGRYKIVYTDPMYGDEKEVSLDSLFK